jgi:hypothetical protein
MGGAGLPADTGIRSADQSGAVPAAPRARQARDPRRGVEAREAPAAGRPGRGAVAILRRQPALIMLGRMHGGYTGPHHLPAGR